MAFAKQVNAVGRAAMQFAVQNLIATTDFHAGASEEPRRGIGRDPTTGHWVGDAERKGRRMSCAGEKYAGNEQATGG